MAIVKPETAINVASGFGHLPITRQVGMFVGLALSIVIAIAVAFWAKQPHFRPIFNDLTMQDLNEVSDALQKAGIEYRIDENTGSLLIPQSKFYKAKMALASDGLPRNAQKGFSRLETKQKFGTSQFMERAQYMHALQGELEQTISSFDNIKQARVHIAMPRESAFVRNFRKPSASVLIETFKHDAISQEQVAAIVHLISSSVPGMDKAGVSIADQTGRLLTEEYGGDSVGLADRKLKYIKQLETLYLTKVEDLLVPVLGPGKVKVRVSADVDFTHHESTKELFDSENPALRSEQNMQEQRADSAVSKGAPGAASNQSNNPTSAEQGSKTQSENSNRRSQSTKNFELNKTISHTRNQVGQIKRLSVAILVDDFMREDEKTGKMLREPLKPEELEQIKKLAQDAIGFDAARGDTVTVINRSFFTPAPPEELPEVPIWQQDWFMDAVKQGLGALFVLYLIFGVLRPLFKSLATRGVAVSDLIAVQDGDGINEAEEQAGALADELAAHDEQMRLVKEMATSDPKRVAQVVKRWMDSD